MPRLATSFNKAGFIQTFHSNPAATTVLHSDPHASATTAEIVAGLLAPHPTISPKFFYDALGSTLFEAICALPEYYPTRTEAAIFDAVLPQIAASVGLGTTLIDLGAGNCAKAARLFPLIQPAQYVPVDISVDHMHDALDRLQQCFPSIAMTGLGLDFSTSLDLPDLVGLEKRLFFYPGSSIGNFVPAEAVAFLQRLRAACSEDGGLLIGIDLLKEKALLDAAYDDGLGVTAAFNRNILLHVNHLIGANFDVRDWRHLGYFNSAKSRVEMHLEARRDLNVQWPGSQRHFAQGERIHTENSYKYSRDACIELLAKAGFGNVKIWTDERQWYALIHAGAV
ncbi:MAG: L-histidine N(alpha)-methyltransferase [Pseudomonadota bacterium]